MGRPRTWTDEQLRAAVAASKSYAEVMRRLGLAHGGDGHYGLKRAIADLGCDVSHFLTRQTVRYPWTEDAVRAACIDAPSRVEVLSRMGFEPIKGNLQRLRRHMLELRLRLDHGEQTGPRSKATRWTETQLRAAVANSSSVRQVLIQLGLVPEGGNYRQVQRRMTHLAISTSHFTGQGWNRGWKFDPRPKTASLSELLVAGRWTSTQKLKLRLIREGLLSQKCQICGWAEKSLDGRIPVELDHINGDNSDNRLENLRILCPNCHSLQPTHRGSNQKRRRARVP
jgi:hypothetical protein